MPRLKLVGLFIGITAIVILILYFTVKEPSEEKILSSRDVLLDLGLLSDKLEKFEIDEYFFDEHEIATKVTLRDSKNIFKIEAITDIDIKSADILINDKILTIKALYGNALSPYPGEISNELICNEKFMPEFNTKKTDRLSYSYFILFANDRFTYGACSEDLIEYKSILAWTYCDEKNIFYQFELFSSIESFSESNLELITSFSCLSN